MMKVRTLLAATAVAFAAAPQAGVAFQERPVRSLLEARHQNVVLQEWDTSCGAAALATVLRFQFADNVTERSVAVGMIRLGNADRVRGRGGFSLLDMKRYAESRGLAAEGYADLTAGQLLRAAPAIVPIRSHGGDHFVVFRGVVRGQAVLADPAFGNRSLPFQEFESAWKDRLAFVVMAKGKAANRLFASRRDLLRVEDDAERQAADDSMPKALTDSQLSYAFAVGLVPPAPIPVGAPPAGLAPRPGAQPPAAIAGPTSPGGGLPAATTPAMSGTVGVSTSPTLSVTTSPTTPLSPAVGAAGNIVAPIAGSVGISLPPVSVTISTPPVLSPRGR